MKVSFIIREIQKRVSFRKLMNSTRTVRIKMLTSFVNSLASNDEAIQLWMGHQSD